MESTSNRKMMGRAEKDER